LAINKIFGTTNLIILFLALATLIVGYICLGQGPADNPVSLSVAPVLLIAAYCILIPVAIIKNNKSESDENK